MNAYISSPNIPGRVVMAYHDHVTRRRPRCMATLIELVDFDTRTGYETWKARAVMTGEPLEIRVPSSVKIVAS